MTLVETSEREVIEKARALYHATLPEVSLNERHAATERFMEAVALLEERERVAAQIAQGVIPPENLIFSEEPIVTAPHGFLYCVDHNDSHTNCPVALHEREHVVENPDRDDVKESGEVSPTGYKVYDLWDCPKCGAKELATASCTNCGYGTYGQMSRDANVEASPGIPVNHQHSPNPDWRKDSDEEFPADPQPTPMTRPAGIRLPIRKLSRREQEIEKRRRSDPTGADRDDIDYSSIEDPEVR